jgi:hypothetical protein
MGHVNSEEFTPTTLLVRILHRPLFGRMFSVERFILGAQQH